MTEKSYEIVQSSREHCTNSLSIALNSKLFHMETTNLDFYFEQQHIKKNDEK